MSKPTGAQVAAMAVTVCTEGRSYAEMDCQAFVEYVIGRCGGSLSVAGSNAMARRAVSRLDTLQNAQAADQLVPGAVLFIRENDESGLPAAYRGDGLGDFSHVGLYVGPKALTDTDQNGRLRACDVVHSSATMGRVAGSTLQNGWTHVGQLTCVDYSTSLFDEPAPALTSGTPAKGALATVTAPSGQTVKLRKAPSKRCRVYWQVAVGTAVPVERQKEGWSLVTARCTDGRTRRAYLQSRFLQPVEEGV